MTDQSTRDDQRANYEARRDAFGAALVSAAGEQERVRGRATPTAVRGTARPAPAAATLGPSAASRRRRTRAALGGLALTAGLAALAIGIPRPGGNGPGEPGGGPSLLGVSPAVAAVSAIRESLHDVVLFRDVENHAAFRDANVRQRDWTDLATRDQHLLITGGRYRVEYWNPSLHERWTLEPLYRAADGRRVVTRTTSDGENSSASESPTEEIDRLLADARAGRVTMRDGRTPSVRVLEQRQQCYAAPDDSVGECPDPEKPSAWPGDVPKGMRPVLMYQRWWITTGKSPRMLRYDNGNLTPQGTDRRSAFTSVYRAWTVLPRTDTNLALVRPPAFPNNAYLVLKGGDGLIGGALRNGEIVCPNGPCPQ